MLRRSFSVMLVVLSAVAVQADEPRIVRENIEWLDVWIPGNADAAKPKVLLIGDSITRAYYKVVEDQLKEHAVVCRLATSKSLGDPALLDEVRLVLGQARFSVIHFNNGMHGWGYTEEEYARALPALVAVIRKGAPQARLIWGQTTPVRVAGGQGELADRTERVRVRNAAAAKQMEQNHIPINDLFRVVIDKPKWFSKDGVHLNTQGTAALGSQVAEHVRKELQFK